MSLREIFKKYGALTIAELVELARQRPQYLVEGLIPEKSVGMLVGEWGIGKSPLALQLAMTLACGGKKFLGRYATPDEPTASLYVDFENGAEACAKLANAITSFLKMGEPPSNLRLFSPNYSESSSELKDRTTKKLVCEMIEECSFRFVVIDPLRMFEPGAESSNTDAATMIQSLRELCKRSGVTILLVHHPRKPRADEVLSLEIDPHQWMQTASGASALVQNVDFRIGLQLGKNDDLITRSYARLKGWGPTEYLVRVRNPETGEPAGYRLEGGIDKLQAKDREVFDSLASSFTTGEAKRLLRLSANPTNERLKQWESLGIIEKKERGEWAKRSREGNGEQDQQDC